MKTPDNMLGHVSSAACRPGNELVPFGRVVGAVCVRAVRRLLGIRRYQSRGQNNLPPLVALAPCLVCKSFNFKKHTLLIRFAGIRVRAGGAFVRLHTA